MKNVVLVGRKNLTVAMLSFMLPLGFQLLFSGSVMSATVEKVQHYGETYNMDNNMSTFLLFEEEAWGKLSLQEKLDAAQVVVNCEANYLGLSIDLNVEGAWLDENIAGCYVDETHQIKLDIDFLEEYHPRYVLQTICHEVYHAYQHQLCLVYQSVDESHRGLLIFNQVDRYIEEFENYVDANEDYEHYNSQHCEILADSYADKSVREYYVRINQYLREQDLSQSVVNE